MSTGTSSTVSAPAFHADDPEQTGDYRTLSVLAIISLVVGLAAPLALGSPLLMVIPLFGIALAILALRRIAVSGGALAGNWAAMAGLMLCVASANAPFSRDLVFRAIRLHEAKRIAQGWLEILTSGESERAFRLTIDGARPQPAPDPAAPPPKTTPYKTFLDLPEIKALKSIGANAEIRFAGTVEYEPRTYRNITVKQRFDIRPPSGDQEMEVVITVQRAQITGESMSRWLVVRCETANATAPSIATQ